MDYSVQSIIQFTLGIKTENFSVLIKWCEISQWLLTCNIATNAMLTTAKFM